MNYNMSDKLSPMHDNSICCQKHEYTIHQDWVIWFTTAFVDKDLEWSHYIFSIEG